METKDTHIEGLDEIARRIAGDSTNFPGCFLFEPYELKKLLTDPAILAHIPAVKALQEENNELHDKVEQLELDEGIWPEWAETLLKMIRKRSGYDGYADDDGVSLPEELCELFVKFDKSIATLEAQLAEVREREDILCGLLGEAKAQLAGGEAAVLAEYINRMRVDWRAGAHRIGDILAQAARYMDDKKVSANQPDSGKVPHDFLTHKDSWRDAIAQAADNANCDADRSYWLHELRAYDRAHEELASAPIAEGLK